MYRQTLNNVPCFVLILIFHVTLTKGLEKTFSRAITSQNTLHIIVAVESAF